MSISSSKHRFPVNSWFSDISKVTFLWLFLITPYLSTWNIDLPPWDLFLNSNEENNIIIWHFVKDKCQVPNSDPHGFEYIISNLEFSFFELFLMILNEILPIFHENMKSQRRGISWDSFCRRNFRKSLNMNLVSIKKHETLFPKNESTFLFLGEVNPYH